MLALALVLVLAMAACAPAPQVLAPAVEMPFPSPLSGPGQPEITAEQQRVLHEAWKQLLAGQPDSASEMAAGAGELPQAKLLRAQAGLSTGEETPAAEQLEPLLELATAHPGYAALWATISVMAEQAGDEPAALHAAQECARLWHKQPWSGRADALHQRWVEHRVDQASALAAEDQADAALELLDTALGLDPESHRARLVKAELLIDIDRVEDAEQLLAELPGDPDALLLAGRIAEGRKDWLTAMDLYSALPEGYEGRDQALQRAQLQWRLANLPEHVQRALASPRLSRAELAVLLVALAPQVEGFSDRTVPVLSDIVDLPSYREILVATGLQLIEIDPLEHRFYPNRAADPEVVRSAITALCHLLGFEPPPWCEPDIVIPSCIEITAPITGEEVAALLIQFVQGEGR